MRIKSKRLNFVSYMERIVFAEVSANLAKCRSERKSVELSK